jgi:hypothetical protein
MPVPDSEYFAAGTRARTSRRHRRAVPRPGNSPRIKLHYDLAKGRQEPGNADVVGWFRSLADELATEPHWPDELSEEDAETAQGHPGIERLTPTQTPSGDAANDSR